MSRVITSCQIASVDEKIVWDIIKAIERYPDFMEHVVEVEVLHDDQGVRDSTWTVLFNGNRLRWTERAQIDDDRYEVGFEQLDGDLAAWRGKTSISRDGAAVVATFDIEFDVGVPALAELITPLAEQAVRTNCEQMLQAITKRVEERCNRE